jgi:hypothetical protein
VPILRQRTFHYPSPANRYNLDQKLEEALRALATEEVTAVVEEAGFFRWRFAYEVALTLALAKHDPERLCEQTMLARDGAIGLVNFATRAWEAPAWLWRGKRTTGVEPATFGLGSRGFVALWCGIGGGCDWDATLTASVHGRSVLLQRVWS